MAMVGVASGCLQANLLTARVVRPGLRVGGRLAPCHIHHMNRLNSCSGFDLSYDDITINIVVIIIIIILNPLKILKMCQKLVS